MGLADGEERISYGHFHVFHRVENGLWRMVADWDAPGATAAEYDALG